MMGDGQLHRYEVDLRLEYDCRVLGVPYLDSIQYLALDDRIEIFDR